MEVVNLPRACLIHTVVDPHILNVVDYPILPFHIGSAYPQFRRKPKGGIEIDGYITYQTPNGESMEICGSISPSILYPNMP